MYHFKVMEWNVDQIYFCLFIYWLIYSTRSSNKVCIMLRLLCGFIISDKFHQYQYHQYQRRGRFFFLLQDLSNNNKENWKDHVSLQNTFKSMQHVYCLKPSCEYQLQVEFQLQMRNILNIRRSLADLQCLSYYLNTISKCNIYRYIYMYLYLSLYIFWEVERLVHTYWAIYIYQQM